MLNEWQLLITLIMLFFLTANMPSCYVLSNSPPSPHCKGPIFSVFQHAAQEAGGEALNSHDTDNACLLGISALLWMDRETILHPLSNEGR